MTNLRRLVIPLIGAAGLALMLAMSGLAPVDAPTADQTTTYTAP